ncbi:MAG: hypothetical protein K5872_08220 [Rhizobiaceae bacterium]|nr:hypothetical protein [Rhizobiaceae bacterium]MCV0406199.1 hypothetical protein [Rhizobiaceae bacterium]
MTNGNTRPKLALLALGAFGLSVASASASSFVTLPATSEKITASMVALGQPDSTPSVVAMGTPVPERDPGVEDVKVASIGEAQDEAETPAWVADQIALFEAVGKPAPRRVRQVGDFQPMVFRGGLRGEAFPAASPRQAVARDGNAEDAGSRAHERERRDMDEQPQTPQRPSVPNHSLEQIR